MSIGTPGDFHPDPASLHASLMARLDRLGAAKEVAQIGTAIYTLVLTYLTTAYAPI